MSVIHIRLIGPSQVIDNVLNLLPKHAGDRVLRDEGFPLDKASVTNIEIYNMLGKEYPWTTLDTYFDAVEKHALSIGWQEPIQKHAFSGLREVVLSKHAFSWQVCNLLKACFALWPTLTYDIRDKDDLVLRDTIDASCTNYASYDYDSEPLVFAVYRVNTAPASKLAAITERFKGLAELAKGYGAQGQIADSHGGLGNGNYDEYGYNLRFAAQSVYMLIDNALSLRAIKDIPDLEEWEYAEELVKSVKAMIEKYKVLLDFSYSRWEGKLRNIVFNAALTDLEAVYKARKTALDPEPASQQQQP